MLQDCETDVPADRDGANAPDIRSLWNGELSDAVRVQFDALKNHLTPSLLSEGKE